MREIVKDKGRQIKGRRERERERERGGGGERKR